MGGQHRHGSVRQKGRDSRSMGVAQFSNAEYALFCWLRLHGDVAESFGISSCNEQTSVGSMLLQLLEAQGIKVKWHPLLPRDDVVDLKSYQSVTAATYVKAVTKMAAFERHEEASTVRRHQWRWSPTTRIRKAAQTPVSCASTTSPTQTRRVTHHAPPPEKIPAVECRTSIVAASSCSSAVAGVGGTLLPPQPPLSVESRRGNLPPLPPPLPVEALQAHSQPAEATLAEAPLCVNSGWDGGGPKVRSVKARAKSLEQRSLTQLFAHHASSSHTEQRASTSTYDFVAKTPSDCQSQPHVGLGRGRVRVHARVPGEGEVEIADGDEDVHILPTSVASSRRPAAARTAKSDFNVVSTARQWVLAALENEVALSPTEIAGHTQTDISNLLSGGGSQQISDSTRWHMTRHTRGLRHGCEAGRPVPEVAVRM